MKTTLILLFINFLLVGFADAGPFLGAGSGPKLLGLSVFQAQTFHTCDSAAEAREESACPPALIELNRDDDKSKALFIKSASPSCRVGIDSARQSARPEMRNPYQYQDYLEKNHFAYLGEFSNRIARKCSSGATFKAGQDLVSKYYFYLAQINEASKKIGIERQVTADLLGKPQPPCPDAVLTNHAFLACMEYRKCPKSESLDSLAVKAEKAEKIFEEAKASIKEFPATCDTDPKCKEEKMKVANIITGSMMENPWLTNPTYVKSRKEFDTDEKRAVDQKKRLKKYLEDVEKTFDEDEASLKKAAACVQGDGDCNIDQIRATVAKTPEMPDLNRDFKDSNFRYANTNFQAQQCINSFAVERNGFGDYYKTVATIPLFLAGFGVANTAVQGTKAVSLVSSGFIGNLMKNVTTAGTLGLFAVDAYFTSHALNAIGKSCFSDAIKLDHRTPLTNDNICESNSSSLSPSSRKYGSCMLSSAVGVVAAAGLIYGGVRTRGLLEDLSATRRKSDFSLSQLTKGLVTEDRRVGPGPFILEPAGKVVARNVQIPSVAKIPERAEIVQIKNLEGVTQTFYKTPVKLGSGEWKVQYREISVDPTTGLVNANYPGGRQLFEDMAKEQAGQAYLGFLDLSSLGFVSKEFSGGGAAGMAQGDRYLKSVADTILKTGEGKITAARLGGDEIGLIIAEKDPKKVQELLTKIREQIRKDQESEAKKVFREEKIRRAQDFKAQLPSKEELAKMSPEQKNEIYNANREQLDALARVQQPDISVGSAAIGANDTMNGLLAAAEKQAKALKIETVLQFGRDASKYGDFTQPSAKVRPTYAAKIAEPVFSKSWTRPIQKISPPPLDTLQIVQSAKVEVLKRFQDITVSKVTDEAGLTSVYIQRFKKTADENAGAGSTIQQPIAYEIPVKGQGGLMDGQHPESQNLMMSHFTSNPENVLVLAKFKDLKLANYLGDGTQTADKFLTEISAAVQKTARQNDLMFKLPGADFTISADKTTAAGVDIMMNRINSTVRNDPQVKSLIQTEKSAIQRKIDDAIDRGDTRAAKGLAEQMENLQNFSTDLTYVTLKPGEVKVPDYKEVIKQLEDKLVAKPK